MQTKFEAAFRPLGRNSVRQSDDYEEQLEHLVAVDRGIYADMI